MSLANYRETTGRIKSGFLLICIYFGIIAISKAQLPDLVINKPRLAASVELQRITVAAGECSVVEGCVPEGTRRLLKFDVGFQNAGNGDLIIGDPNARPDLFETSTCHGHFHMTGVAGYELLSAAGDTVVRARKQGWCFRDSVKFRAGAGPATYDCDNQGISAGWEDIYDKSLDCQWLDVTGVPGGKYLLRVVVNPDFVFEESNYDNNVVTVSITLPGATQVTTPPTTPTQAPKTTPTTTKPKVTPGTNKGKIDNAWKKLKDKFKQKKPKKPKKHKGKGKAIGHSDDKHEHDDDGK